MAEVPKSRQTLNHHHWLILHTSFTLFIVCAEDFIFKIEQTFIHLYDLRAHRDVLKLEKPYAKQTTNNMPKCNRQQKNMRNCRVRFVKRIYIKCEKANGMTAPNWMILCYSFSNGTDYLCVFISFCIACSLSHIPL